MFFKKHCFCNNACYPVGHVNRLLGGVKADLCI